MCNNDPNREQEQNNIDSIKELGVQDPSKIIGKQRFQVLPIIGQIEGHSALPPQSKATKYEHLIPQ